MQRIPFRRPSPAMIVAILALVVAMAGSAGASPQALISKLTSAKVKTIAKGVANAAITTKAPLLSVASAKEADHAKTADSATKADSATTAGGAPPTGAAGGSLSGTFPNPGLADAAVTTAKLAEKGVTGAKIADHTIGSTQIAPGSLGGGQIADGQITMADLDNFIISANKLGPIVFAQGTGVAVPNGQTKEATVTCPGGSVLISSGIEWLNATGGTQDLRIAPDPADPSHKVIVRGRVVSGSDNNTIFAEASCLLV